jgi:predicted Kef-type K+ transport protein
MLERLKRALVDSYIGAIALGWLLAQDVMYFVGIFSTPVTSWVSQNTYREMTQKATGLAGFPFQAALPELVRAFLLLMVWSVLIRWLYFTSFNPNSLQPAQAEKHQTQGTSSQ